MTIYDMVKNRPSFKRFCARQSLAPHNLETTLAKAHKKTLAEIKSFMRPRGIWSVIGPYDTGRLVRSRGDCEHQDCADCNALLYESWESLKIRKVAGEFISDSPDPDLISVEQQYTWEFGKVGEQVQNTTNDETLRLLALLEEQNRLLKSLAA